MSFGEILNSILIKPISLVFETIFYLAYSVLRNPGTTIVVLSLAINLLVLPLYRRADILQQEERDIEEKLQPGVDHIKKTFSGDERMMILQTYYRQNHYKPTYVVRSAVPLLLQIPFFIAAYNFLSDLVLLRGASLGPIRDLSEPDALLTVAGITINVLPVLMTLINVVSSAIYSKGYPLKNKLQLYGMALFFLVFLYKSPAGLVFYWTLNNVFSLLKTIFYKLKHSGIILSVGSAIGGAVILTKGLNGISRILRPVVIGAGVLCFLPLGIMLCSFVLRKFAVTDAVSGKADRIKKDESTNKVFYFSAAFLSLLIGLLIPSGVIKSSPLEFYNVTTEFHPLWYIVSSFCIAVGVFLVWMNVFYNLATAEGKRYFSFGAAALCGIALINYMFFGKSASLLTSRFTFELEDKAFSYSAQIMKLNAVLIVAAAALIVFAVRKWSKVAARILLIGVCALVCMSGYYIKTVNDSVSALRNSGSQYTSKNGISLPLSSEGKNVIVFMLDRAMGEYVPYIMDEKPELVQKFDGFTYYSNTISHGTFTNFGTPGLFGGYEYTPLEMNRRDDELLVDKQNEALKVMPELFSRNGYDVTVCNPPYAGYTWIPDLSIYDDIPNTKAHYLDNLFGYDDETLVDITKRNSFCYGVMKCMPVIAQEHYYNHGRYLSMYMYNNSTQIGVLQTVTSLYTSSGYRASFNDRFAQLQVLPSITNVTDDSSNHLLLFANETTHEPMMLQEPEYEPAFDVDNTAYEAERGSSVTLEGRTLKFETEEQLIHYQTTVAAFKELGKWFDYLRESGVYDNTRIILVADHGTALDQLDDLIYKLNDKFSYDAAQSFPLLMVKDFDAKGFETSTEFMTSADVPTLATEGLIENPINPFTGKKIDNQTKYAQDQLVFVSNKWNTETNNGERFQPGRWLSVHDDIWEKDNWELVAENTDMPN